MAEWEYDGTDGIGVPCADYRKISKNRRFKKTFENAFERKMWTMKIYFGY